MVIVPDGLYFWEGEKPSATPCEYTDKSGNLITSIATATLVAKTKIGIASEVDVPCTNNDDGTFDIDWPKGGSASVFILASGVQEDLMRIDVEITEGDGSVWYLGRWSVPVMKRV